MILMLRVFIAFLVPALAFSAGSTPSLHPRALKLPFNHQGSFVTTADGGVLCVDARNALRSTDEGKTWASTPVFREPTKYKISDERALLRTRDGVVIAAWMNGVERTSRT